MENVVEEHRSEFPIQNLLSSEEKLIWLSRLRVGLNEKLTCATSGDDEDNRRAAPATKQLMEILKGLLQPGEDVFVLYAAQQVLVAIMKWNNPQEGIILIKTFLERDYCSSTMVLALEVCQVLLSKQNYHCCSFLEDIQANLKLLMKTYTDTPDKNNFIIYQLVRIFFKVTKLASLHKTECAFSLLKDFLSNCTVFLDILFQSDVERFIKRKICLTLYFIVQPASDIMKSSQQANTVGRVNYFDNELVLISECFIRTVLDVGFTSLIRKSESLDGFTGAQNQTRGTDDYGYLREWSILSLGMALPLLKSSVKGNDELSSTFLLTMDDCITQVTGKQGPVPFSWLPTVFADQDDMWVDALLMLMDIHPSLLTVEPHWYFLQFVSCLVYDDLVLVDLLTSPETRFIDYLTRYLKYLVHTGTQFSDTVDRFQHYNRSLNEDCTQHGQKDCLKHDLCDESDISCEIVKQDCDDCVDHRINSNSEQHCRAFQVENVDSNLTHCIDSLDNTTETLSTKSIKGTCNKLSDVINDQVSDSAVKHLFSISGPQEKPDCVVFHSMCPFALLPQDCSEVQNSPGLAMLMDTYSDSDEEEYDDLEQAVNKTGDVGCESESSHTTVISALADDSAHLKKHIYVERQFELAGINADCVTRSGAGGYEMPTEGGKQFEDTPILDRTLSMLIRVALKLQRMWQHQILSYDPTALIKLLEEVEICLQTTDGNIEI